MELAKLRKTHNISFSVGENFMKTFYIEVMARGWESKSVEAQQEAAAGSDFSGKPRLTRLEADRLREQESLRLSMKRMIEQLDHAQNPRHRQMLEKAKLALERKIANLDS